MLQGCNHCLQRIQQHLWIACHIQHKLHPAWSASPGIRTGRLPCKGWLDSSWTTASLEMSCPCLASFWCSAVSEHIRCTCYRPAARFDEVFLISASEVICTLAHDLMQMSLKGVPIKSWWSSMMVRQMAGHMADLPKVKTASSGE